MLDSKFLEFAEWLGQKNWSVGLHESFYLYNWIESTHVLTLTVSLGMLFIIDLRMLGLCLPNVSAATIAARFNKPMMVGFTLMFITGILLYSAIPVRTTQSIWFRLKVLMLIAAAVNAWLFHRHMRHSINNWDRDPIPPKRTRIAAATSLTLWMGIVICGRLIAYDWYDCGQMGNSAFINWASGCTIQANP